MTEVYEVKNSIEGPILDQIQVDTTDAIAAKRARQLEGIKRSKAKYYQSIKEKPEFLERIAKNSKIYYDRHKDDPDFKEYKIKHVKAYQEKNKEYYTNQRHERRLKEVAEKLEELGFERIAEILIAHKKVKILDSYDSINVSE